MLLAYAAAAIAVSASAPPVEGIKYSVQGRVTIRIVNSVRLRVGAERSEEGRPLRMISLRGESGSLVPAKVVEFE
jgi:hypothetical protein